MIATASGKARVELLPSQHRFLRLPRKYRAYIGGVGAGKTWIGSYASMMGAQQLGDGIVVAPTYRMLEDVSKLTLLEQLHAYRIPHEYQASKNLVRIKRTDGSNKTSTVFFRSGNDPNRLRGPNLTWAWLDEAALMPRRTWEVIQGRIRIGRTRAWITTTPAGFNWIHERWVERAGTRYGMVQASTRENFHLADDFVAELVESYSAEFAKQEIDGEFVAFEGLVYPEVTQGVHVVEPFEIPKDWRIVGAIDHGYTNPFVFLWIALDEDDRMYVVDEHYLRRALPEEHVEAIKRRDGVWRKPEWIVADHDALGNAELRKLGILTVNADKENWADGFLELKSRLVVQPDGRPRLIIFKTCVNLIKELGTYRWGEHRPDAITGIDRSMKERPIKEADHGPDALAYAAKRLITTVSRISSEKSTKGGYRPLTAGLRSKQF